MQNKNVAIHNDWASNFFRIMLIGAPLWWILGFNFFIYHFVAAIVMISVIHTRRNQRTPVFVPSSFYFVLFIVVCYSASLLVHSFGDGGSRVIASIYNLSFWVMGLCLILAISNVVADGWHKKFFGTFLSLSAITGISIAVLFLVGRQGIQDVNFESPLYELTNLFQGSDLAEQTFRVTLLRKDWLASLTHARLNLLSPYPTATGGLMMVILFLILTHASMFKFKMYHFVLLALNFGGLLMTLSRMSALAFLTSFVIVYIIQKKRALLWILVFILVLVLMLPWLIIAFDWLMGLREYSSSVRLNIYLWSLQQFQGVDWILGFGLRPRVNYLIFPLGSHCTYLSLLFKTGILGTTCFILFQISLFFRWFKFKKYVQGDRELFGVWRGTGWVLTGMAIWMIADDMDAPQLLAFVYFSVIGIFEGVQKRLNQELSANDPQPESM